VHRFESQEEDEFVPLAFLLAPRTLLGSKGKVSYRIQAVVPQSMRTLYRIWGLVAAGWRTPQGSLGDLDDRHVVLSRALRSLYTMIQC
jgi:hypothetical protein